MAPSTSRFSGLTSSSKPTAEIQLTERQLELKKRRRAARQQRQHQQNQQTHTQDATPEKDRSSHSKGVSHPISASATMPLHAKGPQQNQQQQKQRRSEVRRENPSIDFIQSQDQNHHQAVMIEKVRRQMQTAPKAPPSSVATTSVMRKRSISNLNQKARGKEQERNEPANFHSTMNKSGNEVDRNSKRRPSVAATTVSAAPQTDRSALLRKVLNKSMERKKAALRVKKSLVDSPLPTDSPIETPRKRHEDISMDDARSDLHLGRRKTFGEDSRPPKSAALTATDHPLHSQVTRSAHRQSDTDGNYRDFVQTLQKEVSSDHKELWRSFRSLFGKSGRPLSAEESASASNLPPILRKRQRRQNFDSKTKQQLADMNSHLLQKSAMDSTRTAQLVNDQKLSKSRRASKASSSSVAPLPKPDEALTPAVGNTPDVVRRYLNRNKLNSSPPPPPIREEENDQVEVELGTPPKVVSALDEVEVPHNDSVEVELIDDTPEHHAIQTGSSDEENRNPAELVKRSALNRFPSVPSKKGRETPANLSALKQRIASRKRTEDASTAETSPTSSKGTIETEMTSEENSLPKAFVHSGEAIPRLLSPIRQERQSTMTNTVPPFKALSPRKRDRSELEAAFNQQRFLKSPRRKVEAQPVQRETQFLEPPVLRQVKQSFGSPKEKGAPTDSNVPEWSKVKLRPAPSLESPVSVKEKDTSDVPWLRIKLRHDPASHQVSSTSTQELVDVSTDAPQPVEPSIQWVSIDKENPPSLAEAVARSMEDDKNSEVSSHSEEPKVPKPDWREQLKQRLKENPNLKDPSETPSSSASSDVPWKGVKLRSDGRPAQSGTKASAPPTGESTTAAPWAKVQLRSVDSNEAPLMKSDVEEPQREPETILPFRQMLRKVASPIKADDTQNPSSGDKDKAVDSLGLAVGDEVDLDKLPFDVLGINDSLDDRENLCLPLENVPGMSSVGEINILTGRRLIAVVRRSRKDDQRGLITWVVRRNWIESLAMDLAQNRADLVMEDSKKSLTFTSIESCLQFANQFYETNRKDDPAKRFKEQRETNANSTRLPEQPALSEEELHVLEQYRERRKVKPPKDALRETIGADPLKPKLSPKSGLCAQDQELVSKYKKMLKLNIPKAAVEHKMRRDAVAPHIVAAVLGEESAGESNGTEEKMETGKSTATTGGLTIDEEKVASTYQKMLKMKIPSDAVAHKMKRDGVDQKIVNAVLGALTSDESNSKSNDGLSEEEQKSVLQYQKMLKMMIPADAVRHKMRRDGMGDKVMFAVFPEDAPKNEKKQSEVLVLTNEEEILANSYRKMLKMMIPADAVRHKMVKDNVDNRIMLVVLGPDASDQKGDTNALSKEEEAIADSFRRMLKMKIPEDAVRHRMLKEGISEKIMRAVLGDGAFRRLPKAATKKGSRLVALHWTPLSGQELEKSVWRNPKKRKVETAQPEGKDISKLVELFQKKINPKGGVAQATSSKDGNGKANILEVNRAQNVAITLNGFKDFTYEHLAETIDHLDPLRKIRGERVQFMGAFLPTDAEAKAIKAYRGDESCLVPAELFFRKIANVKRIGAKVRVIQTMDTLQANAMTLSKSFQVLASACLQVQRSDKLQDVLEMVLHVGNIMNEGTRTGGAAGFKFESLLKLTQTKSSDGKTTVLDYIVMIFVAKDKRSTLKLTEDFPDCQDASRMLIGDMQSDLKSMSGSLAACKTELGNLKKDLSKVEATKNAARGTLLDSVTARCQQEVKEKTSVAPRRLLLDSIQSSSSNVGSDDRKSLLDAIKARESDSVKADPRNALLAAIKNQAQTSPTKAINSGTAGIIKALTSCTSPDLVDSDPDKLTKKDKRFISPCEKEEASLKAGIQRLETFVTEAEEVLARLVQDKEKAMEACRELATYCGEQNGGAKAATSLLEILSSFASNLDRAVESHDRKVELEAKKSRKSLGPKAKPGDTSIERDNKKRNLAPLTPMSQSSKMKEKLPPRSPLSPTLRGNRKTKHQIVKKPRSQSDRQLKIHQFAGERTDTKVFDAYNTETGSSTSGSGSSTSESSVANAKAKLKENQKGPSIVFMVNEMLKDATDEAKKDFVRGDIHEYAEDPTLQAIYEREQERWRRNRPVGQRADLLAAIRASGGQNSTLRAVEGHST